MRKHAEKSVKKQVDNGLLWCYYYAHKTYIYSKINRKENIMLDESLKQKSGRRRMRLHPGRKR